MSRARFASWGRYPPVRPRDQRVLALHDRHAGLPGFDGSALPYGNGRSYGDSCLNPGGTLLHARRLDRFIRFDPDAGVLECEAGVLLAEIIEMALPRGWFLPVTPGTRFVTVGGAIANDVHGKNHAAAGSFGDHVLDLELLRSDGSRCVCSPQADAGLFRATIGGLGLTGVIVRARLRLRRVVGPALEVEARRFSRLADYFTLAGETAGSEYRVAWVDCLARGAALGRGVYTHGCHAQDGAGEPQVRRRRLAVPWVPPFSLINGLSLRAFNALYYRRVPARAMRRVQHYRPFFYPLDEVADWNRMYGPRGFLQYQCVVPPDHAQEATAEMLDRIAASGEGSFLAVLKQFGQRPAPGLLSFPRPGTTLALDFPFRGNRTLALLDALDRVVMAAGGAVYPAKDARMPPEVFAASFPALPAFREHVDPGFSSGLWRRVMGQT
ncbi:MAG TPA: FAD-binding oxidoreductase [Pseudoxanthomonas sp.]|nr:FAD-binding oxidoreductase [Pseudoxanthomonas sp.]